MSYSPKTDKKFHPKRNNSSIVRYFELNEIEGKDLDIIKSVVALANSDGGEIFIGCKTRYSTKKQAAEGGIPDELKSSYQEKIDSIIEKIPNYVEGFTMHLIGTGWVQRTFSTDYYLINVQGYDKTLLTLNWPERNVNAVYVRENGITVKYASTKLSISSTRRRVKYKILKPVTMHPDLKDYKLINIQKPLEQAYKYMTLEAFTLSLLKGTWQFAEPTRWNDEYEGRFYRADYNALKVPNCPSKLYATCITGEKANEAAWKVYAHGQGLGSRCIQIRINMNVLRKELSNGIPNHCFDTEGTIYEGTVFYDLSDQEIKALNTPSGAYYNTFFESFDMESFLKLLLIKRKAYEYEKETRLFFVPKDYQEIDRSVRSGNGDVMYVKVNWKDIIEEIQIDKKCSKAELETIKFVCKQAGINIHNPNKRGPKKADEIWLKTFNVDEMEGKKKITIYPKKP